MSTCSQSEVAVARQLEISVSKRDDYIIIEQEGDVLGDQVDHIEVHRDNLHALILTLRKFDGQAV
ncbi:hypothetical protein N8D56_04890 [Devosia sp. A8/3-2]|nr:hypothetical protein N8D56_04890 [Devosia sp. A8/3-2]